MQCIAYCITDLRAEKDQTRTHTLHTEGGKYSRMILVLVNTDFFIYKIHMEDREDLVQYTRLFILISIKEPSSLDSVLKSHNLEA